MRVASGELKTILSNLINNSVEASASQIKLSLDSLASEDFALLCIEDNGNGIAPHLLKCLGTRGFTVGKPHGSGLGLYHAKKGVESWGGKVVVHSKVGDGTKVEILLPKVAPPSFFASNISIETDTEIVILDDDDSIHQVWAIRFSKLAEGGRKFRLRDFSRAKDLADWLKKESPQRGLFLCDQELLGQEITGLEVIRDFGIGGRSILVTNLYEDWKLRQECQNLGVKMLPKPFAGVIPISVRA